MPLEFIFLNSPTAVVVNSDNRKAMGKEKWHKVKFEKFTKNDSIEFTKKKIKQKQTEKNPKKQTNKQTTTKKTKWKSNFKSTIS